MKPAWPSSASSEAVLRTSVISICSVRGRETFVRKYFNGMKGRAKTPRSLSYGGAGYGKHKRPDLSNRPSCSTRCGLAAPAPTIAAVQKALVFVSRCQRNFESPDTGSLRGQEESRRGFLLYVRGGRRRGRGRQHAQRRLAGRYGSMTYSGLKSMIYAGLKADDPG